MHTLIEFLRKKFPSNLNYKDAVELIKYLHCDVIRIPADLRAEARDKKKLAQVFSELWISGVIVNYDMPTAVFHGSHFHEPDDLGHWIESIASIYKLRRSYANPPLLD